MRPIWLVKKLSEKRQIRGGFRLRQLTAARVGSASSQPNQILTSSSARYPSEAMIQAADEPLDDFTITFRREIVFHLLRLIDAGERVTVSFDEGRESFVTILLRVDEERNALILDWGGSEVVNKRLLNAQRAYVVATPGGVRNQFSTGPFLETTYQSRPAFKAPIPDKFMRLQRRQYFRLALPMTHRPSCAFVTGDNLSPWQMAVVNIGINGVGLETDGSQLPFVAGQIIPDAVMDLGKPGGHIEADLDVRHYELINRGARKIVHVGCRFVSLSPAQEHAIQRFIMHAQRDEKARYG